MQILHILCSARVTDALYQPHCVLVVLLGTAILTYRIESATNLTVSLGTTSDLIYPNTAINLN